jgi:hypothetical protein
MRIYYRKRKGLILSPSLSYLFFLSINTKITPPMIIIIPNENIRITVLILFINGFIIALVIYANLKCYDDQSMFPNVPFSLASF